MTEMTPVLPPPMADLIPDTAPFTLEQRVWLNGFFAGLMSAQAEAAAAGPGTPASAEGGASQQQDDGAPWHDPALAIDERMALAAGTPLPRKLFAAMAQQDCGQ